MFRPEGCNQYESLHQAVFRVAYRVVTLYRRLPDDTDRVSTAQRETSGDSHFDRWHDDDRLPPSGRWAQDSEPASTGSKGLQSRWYDRHFSDSHLSQPYGDDHR